MLHEKKRRAAFPSEPAVGEANPVGFNELRRAGGGPDVRSGLSGLPARVPGQLLRMSLHVAASVQRVGIGPRGRVRVINPYFASAEESAGYRRHRRVY
jgi:hypothetical protein